MQDAMRVTPNINNRGNNDYIDHDLKFVEYQVKAFRLF
jgi:hypothetical protein